MKGSDYFLKWLHVCLILRHSLHSSVVLLSLSLILLILLLRYYHITTTVYFDSCDWRRHVTIRLSQHQLCSSICSRFKVWSCSFLVLRVEPLNLRHKLFLLLEVKHSIQNKTGNKTTVLVNNKQTVVSTAATDSADSAETSEGNVRPTSRLLDSLTCGFILLNNDNFRIHFLKVKPKPQNKRKTHFHFLFVFPSDSVETTEAKGQWVNPCCFIVCLQTQDLIWALSRLQLRGHATCRVHVVLGTNQRWSVVSVAYHRFKSVSSRACDFSYYYYY